MSFQNCKLVDSPKGREYFEHDVKRGDAKYPVSSSMLKEFARCPRRWFDGYNPPESDAKDWGSLFDILALTPEQFSERYVIQPATYKAPESTKKDAPLIDKPWNNNAAACKEWRDAQDGKEIVSSKQVAEAKAAVERLWKDTIIKAWFDACDKQVWVVGEWNDERTGLVIPVKCLIDFAPRADSEFAECLGDLKTVRSGALVPFQRTCFEMGYHIQAAFNLALYNAATGSDRDKWCFILSESFPPFQTGKRMLDSMFIEIGAAKYQQIIRLYCWCIANNNWPGYDDHDEAAQGWTVVLPDPWMQTRDTFAPRFEADTPPATAEEAMERAGL